MSIYASVLSGMQFWQHKRQYQIKGTLGLCDHKTWDAVVVELYKAVHTRGGRVVGKFRGDAC